MKNDPLILALLACYLQAHAQGTMQFYAARTGTNEVPPNNEPTIATETFTLEENILNFLVDVFMKNKLFILVLALFACAFQAQAQGTLQFYARATGANEVPPNTDPTIATGTFTLDGNILNFLLNVPAVTFTAQSAYIQGPALPGINAPVIFELGGPVFHSGSSLGDPPFYSFGSPFDGTFGAGPFTLTSGQINQLQGGLWYVEITSFTMPDGQLRGQIVPVPEPPAWAFLLLAGGVGWVASKRRVKPLSASDHASSS